MLATKLTAPTLLNRSSAMEPRRHTHTGGISHWRGRPTRECPKGTTVTGGSIRARDGLLSEHLAICAPIGQGLGLPFCEVPVGRSVPVRSCRSLAEPLPTVPEGDS